MSQNAVGTAVLEEPAVTTLVQLMLGHSNIGTTQRYLDIEGDELKAAHQKYVN